MTEDILISVKGLHTLNSEQQEEIEVTSPGKYYFRNGKHFVLYDELQEDSKEVIKNRIKLADGFLEIQKKGPLNTCMTFLRGEKSTSWYGTPFGEMQLGIEVTSMQIDEQDNQIDVDVDYALEMNYEHVSDASIHLRIMEQDRGLFRI